MRVLITGGTGFLGTNFYQYLRRKEPTIDIRIFSRRTGGDVRNYGQVLSATEGVDLVIHMAAQTHVDFSLHNDLKDQQSFIDTNVTGTNNVIWACRRNNAKMIHISTSEVYGSSQTPGEAMREDHPIAPQAGIYATTKACADLTCRMATMTTSANIVILRIFNLWGPYQSVEKLIPRMINQKLNSEPLTIYGDGQQRRDYVHAQDASEAIWLAKDLPSGTIANVASGTNYTIESIAKLVGGEVTHVQSRPGEVRELLGDYTRFSLTGWKPKTFINSESMKNLIDWYSVNQFIQQPTL